LRPPRRAVAIAQSVCVLSILASATATAQNVAYVNRYKVTPADIHFMSSMIPHHTQAIAMSKMAATHGASERVRTLAERIINAQQDEIASMTTWLKDHGQPVPMSGDMSMMDMPGMSSDSLMPGMLTPAQMEALDKSRGVDFDRLFLTGMIQHHRGALSMVQTLFASQGAGQDQTVFKFATDVNIDQETEIARMQRMLDALGP
jgi:uncharacterized protein (DUF305 family)